MQATETITLVVNGKEVKARPGITVLEACREAGIYIPYLCWHPSLKPFGACRICMVEIEERGRKSRVTSCTVTVNNGMIITTQNPELEKLREEIILLILSEHPHGCLTCHRVKHCLPTDICLRNISVNNRCVVCPKNGRCELQDVVFKMGIGSGTEVPLPYTYRDLPLEISDPFIHHDMNLCIMCGRCVRACNELEGVNAITFVNRGDRTVIGTAFGVSRIESGCTYCGACVDVCPVGAIVEKGSKWSGPPDRKVTTVCPYCGVGCTIELNVKDNRIVRVTSPASAIVNQGKLCVKGKFGFDFVQSPDRLTTPLIRRNGQLTEASWDEAYDLIASKFNQIKEESGPDAFAFLASGRATNESNFLMQKFARAVIGSNTIDNCART